MPGTADEMPMTPRQGLSWSWELDFDALLAALNEPAPWNRPATRDPAPAPPAPAPPAPAPPAPAPPAPAPPAPAPPAPAPPAPPPAPVADPADPADPAGLDQAEAEFAELVEAMEQGRTREIPLAEVAGRIAESLPTGPDLAGWLATGSVTGLEDGALAGMAASYRRLASWAQAGELAVVAELASRSAAADDQIGVDEERRPARLPDEACAQVSLALTMSHASASWWSDLAVTLRWRLAATGAALAAGQIDLGRARLIADATAALDDETARAVEAKILAGAGDMTTGQLRAALRRAVIAADPEGAERRRAEAELRAKVSLYPDEDGTASLAGYSLPSTRAAAAMARITALARAMKAAGAGGGIDLLRAQVFLGLLLGTLPYIPPAADGPPDGPPEDEPPRSPQDEEPPDDAPGEPPGDAFEEPPEASDGPPGHPGGPPGDPSEPHGNRRRSGSAEGQSPGPVGNRDRAGRPPPAVGNASDTDRDFPGPDAASRDGPAQGQKESCRPPPEWPGVGATIPPGPAAMQGLRPAGGGLVDVQVPWSTLAGDSGEPGFLSRIGPITAAQVRELADLAARDAAVQWRVVVTDTTGRAEAVTPVPQGRGPASSGGEVGGPGVPPGLVRRVTLTIGKDSLGRPQNDDLPAVLRRALRAAVLAAERAGRQAGMDAAAAGGCAHGQESPGYRPSPRLREFVTARDVTCRFPTCRQPVWRCDLDHSVPFHKGGRTCSCNLGGLCRFHHQIKQHRLWQLIQQTPGTFVWTTPAGRAYAAEPDRHAA